MSHPGTALRRAPRLAPHERLGPYMTRRGRFRRLDPLQARPLPGLARLLGAAGWAGMVGAVAWRAVRRERAGA